MVVAIGATAYENRQSRVYASAGGVPSRVEEATGSPVNGPQVYAEHCSICHGDEREGILPSFPPLVGIDRHMKDPAIVSLVRNGKGRMPGFPELKGEELTALLHYLSSSNSTPSVGASNEGKAADSTHSQGMAAAGGALFQQNCAFCHGRDAAGGESGPDLTDSKLVHADVGGDKISEVIRNGRPEKKMPGFQLSSEEMLSIASFIHAQEAMAISQNGRRRGVAVEDLQTGNVEAGKQYFHGAGTCAKCHSATGDLAGVASRYQGLQLEEQMLYPKDVKRPVTVTLSSGAKMSGTLAYLDEFTIGLRDSGGNYHSWKTIAVKYAVDPGLNAHVELFEKYTDDDIHNLMAYLQTLR
jgi:mono/diheme cytochrome c family protein